MSSSDSSLLNISITIVAADAASENEWAKQIAAACEGWCDARIGLSSAGADPSAPGQVVIVDSAMKGFQDKISKMEGKAVYLLVPEQGGDRDRWTTLLADGQIDDFLVHPLRPFEVMSKLRAFHQILLWDEVKQINASFAELVERLRDDLALAERLQKLRAPIRFPEIKGFKVTSRYLAGLKSGGDYFDLAEARTGNQLSLVLSDSSSYGLSSAMLSILMKVAVKLSVEEARSCEDTVNRIREELVAVLNEKDRLSLFFGMISRKDYVLRYLNLGTSSIYYAAPGKDFAPLASQGAALNRASSNMAFSGIESSVTLEPSGRLAVISDGFVEAVGGAAPLMELLTRFRKKEAADALNEMVFQVKSQFAEPGDMPAQDCTAILMDVDAKILRQI